MKLIEVPLSSLPANIAGAEPAPALVKSVMQLGVLEPIILIQNPDGTFDIGAGRRRIKAARLAGLEQIPCIVHSNLDKNVVSLVTNQLRSPNLAVELAAAENLVGGNDEKDVCKLWHLNWQTFSRLLRLRSLITPLRHMLASGKLKQSVGERAAKLPPEVQEKLLSCEKITMKEVSQQFQARREKAAGELPDELFRLF